MALGLWSRGAIQHEAKPSAVSATRPHPLSMFLYVWNVNLHVLFVFKYYIPNWVRLNGKKYQKGDAILVGEKDELPQFAEILGVLVDGPTILFHISILLTLEFVDHFHAYSVKRQVGHVYLLMSSAMCYDGHPYTLYQPSSCSGGSIYYIVLKYVFQ